jgi:hypothetical protein
MVCKHSGLSLNCLEHFHVVNICVYLSCAVITVSLSHQVYNRIIAVAWIHLLCAVACVALAAITGLAFDWAPQFAAAGVGCPLSLLLFFKVLLLQRTLYMYAIASCNSSSTAGQHRLRKVVDSSHFDHFRTLI